MINNRSFFNTYYHIDGCEPGEYQFIVSGLGNQAYAQKHSRIVGRDVLGTVNINFIGVRPIRNKDFDVIGTFVQQVQRVDLGGSIPDWYKRKQSLRQAKEGILKLIAYLEDNMSNLSEKEATISTGSEMSFYKQLAAQDLRPPQIINDQEEQVLKIRLQSRRKMDNSSPMNRLSTKLGHTHNRSVARSSTGLPAKDLAHFNNGGDEFLLVTSDKDEEECKECFNDKNVIVVRTKQETNRGSIMGSNSPMGSNLSPMSPKAPPTPLSDNTDVNKQSKTINLARFGKEDQTKETEIKEDKPEKSKKGKRSENKNKRADPQAARAKTYTLPKDFREELRKLQVMRQKQTSKNQFSTSGLGANDGNPNGRSRQGSDVRDVYTVTTLNPKAEEEEKELESAQKVQPTDTAASNKQLEETK